MSTHRSRNASGGVSACTLVALLLVAPARGLAAEAQGSAPLLFAHPVVAYGGQYILVSMVGNGGEPTLVSKRRSFQPPNSDPESRDLWLDVSVKNVLGRQDKPPVPGFGCHFEPTPLQKGDFVRLGPLGMAFMLPFDTCYGPLVTGANYEIVVHWKTTPPRGIDQCWPSEPTDGRGKAEGGWLRRLGDQRLPG